MKLTAAVFYVLLAAFCVAETNAQWVQTNGPYTAHVQSFAVSGTNVFVLTQEGGVFLTTDNGTTWTSTGLTSGAGTLAASGGILFAGTSNGIYRSTNNGANWNEISNGIAQYRVVTNVAAPGINLFASAYDNSTFPTAWGVFRSTNNGESWFPANTPFSCFVHMVQLGTNLFAVTGSGAFLSSDNGTSWSKKDYSGWGNTTALAVSGTYLFAGIEGGGVFRSSDNGTSWRGVNNGLTDTTITALAVIGTSLFAGTRYSGTIYRSTDNGTSWSAVNRGFTGGASGVTALAVSGANLFAGGYYMGVLLSTDNGAGWTRVNAGLQRCYVRAFAASGKNLYAGGLEGVFLSSNEGASWNPVNGIGPSVSALAVSGTNLFAGTNLGCKVSPCSRGSVFLSADGGTSWTQTGLEGGVIDLGVSGTDLFAAIHLFDLFHSSNNGTSWDTVNIGLEGAWDVDALAISGTNLFAGTYHGGVFRSTDNGTSWNPANVGLPKKVSGDTTWYSPVSCLVVSGANVFAGTGYRGGVYHSTDNGASWREANSGLTDSTVNAFAVWGTNLFAGTERGVFLSTDNGTNWTAAGLPNTIVRSLTVFGTNLFATGDSLCEGYYHGQGVWRRPLSELVAVDETGGPLPGHYSLAQNFPNPFNPSTTIGYALPRRSHVTLTVFNTLGQQVATLVNGELDAGFHEVKFDAAKLSSGVYLYQLHAGAYVETRKLIHVK